MKFKILIVLLAICLIFALGGCGGSGIEIPPPNGNGNGNGNDNGNGNGNGNTDPVDPNNGFDLVPNDVKISVHTLNAEHSELNDQKWLVYDIRLFSVWALDHIWAAECIPLNFLNNRYKEIPQNKLVVLVAEKGKDANDALQILIDKGYDRSLIKILDGGIHAWEKAGYKLYEYTWEHPC